MENTIQYRKGDYVDFRIADDRFRGTILKLICEDNATTPNKAIIEVSACTKKSSEVNVSVMSVNLSQLSPLL